MIGVRDYRVVSIYGHKGGVGKTTHTNLMGGSVLSNNDEVVKLKFKKCLLIDLDGQMNLTRMNLKSRHRFEEYTG